MILNHSRHSFLFKTATEKRKLLQNSSAACLKKKEKEKKIENH